MQHLIYPNHQNKTLKEAALRTTRPSGRGPTLHQSDPVYLSFRHYLRGRAGWRNPGLSPLTSGAATSTPSVSKPTMANELPCKEDRCKTNARQRGRPASRCQTCTRSRRPEEPVTDRTGRGNYLWGRTSLSRSPKSCSRQARAAGRGRGRAEGAPHGRRGWRSLAGLAGRGCVWIAPAAAAAAAALLPAAARAAPPPRAPSSLHLARREGCRLPVLFFPFLFYRPGTGGFPPRDFPVT